MYCPQCQVQVIDKLCSQCGAEVASSYKDKGNKINPSFSRNIVESASGSQQVAQGEETSNWRLEVKRKLDNHYEKKRSSPTLNQRRQKQASSPDRRKPKRSTDNALFDYRLRESIKKDSRVSQVRRPVSKTTTEKPLIRAPVGTRSSSHSRAPIQRTLTLEAPPSLSEIRFTEETEPEENRVSHEVIFSRLLAGIIDLTLPILVAAPFTFTASIILGFEFFSMNSLWFQVSFSVGFYFLNSFFFLSVSGQTPGMYLTDLRLIGEDSEEVRIVSLFVRIAFFLPVVVTVLGLLLAIFDPWCRCLHDRLSSTRIVPLGT